MNKFSIFIAIITGAAVSAQNVSSIDKTTTVSTSSSLEFPANQNRGIILPYVTSAATLDANNAVNGTLIYDRATNRVRGKQNGVWTDFSTEAGTVDASIQTGAVEDLTRKTVIGATSSAAPGVLILEGNNKAMLLPRTASPHLNVKNPAAGMMVYDTTTKQVAFYNGTSWSFWR